MTVTTLCCPCTSACVSACQFKFPTCLAVPCTPACPTVLRVANHSRGQPPVSDAPRPAANQGEICTKITSSCLGVGLGELVGSLWSERSLPCDGVVVLDLNPLCVGLQLYVALLEQPVLFGDFGGTVFFPGEVVVRVCCALNPCARQTATWPSLELRTGREGSWRRRWRRGQA